MNKYAGPSCAICDGDTDVNGLRYAAFINSSIESYCKKCVAKDEHVLRVMVCNQCGCETNEKLSHKVVKKPIRSEDKRFCIRCSAEIKSGAMRVISDGLNSVYECAKCMPRVGAVPDVWYGYGSGVHSEENIAYPNGHPNAGEPIPFHDKASKRDAMRIAGVREAGDRVRGVRNEDMVPRNRKTYI